MLIHLLSDLHLEFVPFSPPDVGADITVLAGDIGQGTKGIRWAQKTFPGPVLMVLGNHEFYGHVFPSQAFPGLLGECRRAAEGSNVHLLENGTFDLQNVRFFGCTLWTDFLLDGNKALAMANAQRGINDYHEVLKAGSYRKLTPEDTAATHHASVRWLEQALRDSHREQPAVKRVVISHHLPSRRSIDPRFLNSPINGAFASNLDHLLEGEAAPVLWIHGHSHANLNYQVGKTQVVCNPRGYPNENTRFNPGLLLLA